MKVGFPSISVEFVPLFAAKDKGLFKKYGLDVDDVVMQGGTQVVQALIGGSLNFAVMEGPFLEEPLKDLTSLWWQLIWTVFLIPLWSSLISKKIEI